MRIDNMKGEFLYRALISHSGSQYCEEKDSWCLTTEFFRTKEDAQKRYKSYEILWPVDEVDRGVMYIPDPSEFND
jgi:hypothetical protein